MSYNGQMNFGLLGDYDALPDIDSSPTGSRPSLEELVALARAAAPAAATARPNGRAASRPAPLAAARTLKRTSATAAARSRLPALSTAIVKKR